MFDLLEEDLATKTPEPVVVLPSRPQMSKDPIVYTMPEKFRVAPRKASPAIVVALIGGGAILFSGIFLAVVLLGKPANNTPAVIPGEQSQVAPTPEIVPPVATGTETLSSSTASTLEQPVTTIPDTTTPTESVLTPESTSTSSSTIQATDQRVSSEQVVYEQGIDSDSDMLTDAEERLYGTNPEKPDTDEDGYLDGNEFRLGFDPLKQEKSKLDAAKYISAYSNEVFGYSLHHPQLWIAKSVPNQSEKEVLISSATGEFVSVTAEDNPKKLSLEDWITNFSERKTSGESQLIGSLKIIETADGLEAFAMQLDAQGVTTSSLVLHIKYELNTKQELNFLTTFQMIVRSLQFKEGVQ